MSNTTQDVTRTELRREVFNHLSERWEHHAETENTMVFRDDRSSHNIYVSTHPEELMNDEEAYFVSIVHEPSLYESYPDGPTDEEIDDIYGSSLVCRPMFAAQIGQIVGGMEVLLRE